MVAINADDLRISRIEGYSILIASCAPVARMFFNFEADAAQEGLSSPNIILPRPISLWRISQSARNSAFDQMESVETFHEELEGRSMRSETPRGLKNGVNFKRGVSEMPSGDVKMMKVVRNSFQGWRKSNWGGFEY
jgi:hypothetical protein